MTRETRSAAVQGGISGAAAWLLLDLVGVPNVFGLGSEAGFIPLIVVGALLGLTRARWLIPAISILLIAVVVIVSWTPVMNRPAGYFIRSDAVPMSASAVVVLSTGVTADGYLTQQGLDRTLKGVELVKSGVAPVLVFTLEQKDEDSRKITATGDQVRIARLADVRSILVTGRVKSTHDEAVEVSRVARMRGWSNIVLVTSPFHTRRACATFEKLGLEVACVPSDSRDIAVRRLVYPHDRLGAFSMWLYETAGTLRYTQLGWI